MIQFRKAAIIVFMFFLLSASAVQAQQASMTVGILPFYSGKEKSSQSDQIVSALSGVFGKYSFIQLVDRSKMDSLLNEISLSQTGLLDEASMIKEGKVRGLQVMVTGSVADGRISARVIHTETQRVLAAVTGRTVNEIEREGEKFARSIEIFLNQENVRSLNNETDGPGFTLWLEKRSGGGTVRIKNRDEIAVGESVIFKFKSSTDGYLTIIDMQPGGDINVLFPNDFSKDNFIKAGVEYSIPGSDDGFEITVSEPAGRDIVKAFFTKKKVEWLDRSKLQGEGFWTVNASTHGEASRKIVITATKLKRSEWATGLIEIEIIKKK